MPIKFKSNQFVNNLQTIFYMTVHHIFITDCQSTFFLSFCLQNLLTQKVRKCDKKSFSKDPLLVYK